MCIRDSDGREHHGQFVRVGAQRLEVGVHGEQHVRGTREVAVSYTHLRAHETVLDLVCRLLLEKKKKQIYYVKLYCVSG